jgi:lysyl-tRNA synthetase class 1
MTDDHRAFWADAVADEVAARNPDEPVVVKGGVSPSGVPHVGHLNELLRGWFVAEALRERGYEVRQSFTSDDRDALRKVPRRLATREFELVELGDDRVDAAALGKNLGKPYTSIPDPVEGCGHDSYGDHFTDLLRQSADLLGVSVEFESNTDLYESGAFEPATRTALDRRDAVREVLTEFQSDVPENYVPFMAQCGECDRLTSDVRAVDLDAGSVEYVCSGLVAGGREIEGCGHAGTATLREGKLPWRVEWPAQWVTLGVDFEPFGKDHAEGSWPSGVAMAERVFDHEPPVPMTYEWFTLGGEPLSSSEGNVVTARDLLDLLEPEVVRYFFALDPGKARDLDVARLDRLVDDFDRLERVALGREDDPDLAPFAERVYPFLVGEVRTDRVRLPYTFAAVLGMTDDRDLRLRMARNEGHVPADLADDHPAVEAALARVERARTWAARTGNRYDYRLQPDLPDVEFDATTAAALDDLADVVEAGADGEEIQGAIYETARDHGVEVGEFFAAGYRLFFDDTEGPRLGEFLGDLDRGFVVRRLRREG